VRRVRVRLRTLVLAAAGVLVLAVGAGFAFFALSGDDAPAPARVPQSGGPPPGSAPDGRWTVAAGSYAGYRVREEYLTVGVKTAVGRTPAVTGSARVRDGRVLSATLDADLTRLESDQGGRDRALRTRGIETDRFPRARFALAGPVALSARPVAARGTLTLHGRRSPVALRVAAARAGAAGLVLAGSAPIAFADFGIAAPSTAGIAKVRDHGVLEFRLRMVVERTAGT
jgi:polyisoprenoid-binding protein YceI